METIIVAIISLIGTAVGAYSGHRLTAYRIDRLERAVQEHNNFARRLPVVENEIANIKKELAKGV